MHIFHFFCSWTMFKVWLLMSNSILFKDLIFWLNQLHLNPKSFISQSIVVVSMYHIKVSPKKERPKTTPRPLYSSLIRRLLRPADRLSKYTTWPTTLIYIRTHCLLTLPNSKWRAHNIDARYLYWISTNTASVHKNQQNWIPQIKSS